MTLVADNPAKPHVKRWTKQEYNALVDRGAFQGMRVYLYRGELIEMPPMGSLHARGIANITSWLVRNFDPEFVVRIQSPFDSPGETTPEPDGAVVTPEQMSRLPQPNQAMLLIEVSDSSIEVDYEKAFEYAAAGVPDYWILDMRKRQIHVYRDVVRDSSAILGLRFESVRVFGESETISPLAKSNVVVAVSELVRSK
jgi:Uma2 family endonuclease